jgi:alkanesulfonate monooxygenase SsuD/methylene tetrahydromethanopterin reductase-like flavin-dependent oxidoreductase (luciferase family)
MQTPSRASPRGSVDEAASSSKLRPTVPPVPAAFSSSSGTRPLAGSLRPRRGAAKAWKFFVRTFGCQMNEHDSERIAATSRRRDGAHRRPREADVVVLNTCCIRENADNKLYGTSAT